MRIDPKKVRTTNPEYQAMLDAVPKHHFESGSKVKHASIEMHSEDQAVYDMFGPRPPELDVYDYDEDGDPVFVRTKTQEEYDIEWKEYEKARKKWTGPGLIGYSAGETTFELSVEFEDGSRARGYWNAEKGEWKWVEWNTIWKRSELLEQARKARK